METKSQAVVCHKFFPVAYTPAAVFYKVAKAQSRFSSPGDCIPLGVAPSTPVAFYAFAVGSVDNIQVLRVFFAAGTNYCSLGLVRASSVSLLCGQCVGIPERATEGGHLVFLPTVLPVFVVDRSVCVLVCIACVHSHVSIENRSIHFKDRAFENVAENCSRGFH